MTDSAVRARIVDLTREMILFESTAARPDELNRCTEFVREYVDNLDGVDVVVRRHLDKPSLTALPHGNPAPVVILCSHLDVVALPAGTVYRSRIEDGMIIGPGAGDMKGALAILLDLFRGFHQRRPGLPLGLVVSSDEETGGEAGVRHIFQDVGVRAGCVILPDSGSIDRIAVEEKGILHLKIVCHGDDGHASRPWLAQNPLDHLHECLSRVRESFALPAASGPDHWHPTCAVTIIRTPNQVVNRIPAIAEAVLDVRFPPPHTVAGMRSQIEKCLGKDMHAESLITAEPTRLQPDPLFVTVMEEVSGRKPELAREHGGSDSRFICPYGIPVIMARPLVGHLHSAEEWINIDSMERFNKICATYLDRKFSVSNE